MKQARLIEFCQKNALVIANTLLQQHKRRLYTWPKYWSFSFSIIPSKEIPGLIGGPSYHTVRTCQQAVERSA